MIRWGIATAVMVLGYAGLVAATQLGSLSREVIDWDESTFILLASRLLEGHLPYVDLFDNKPPMMFFLLAAVMAIFGESLIVVRAFGDVCVLAIALLIVLSLRRFVPVAPAGLAGVLSVAAFAIWPGQYTSTELPAMVFLMGALALLLWRCDRIWAVAAAGLLISLATLTRSNLAVVAVTVGIWVSLAGFAFRSSGVRAGSVVVYAVGGLLPLVLFFYLYWQAGALDEFVLATVTVPLSYADSQLGMGSVFIVMLESWIGLMRWTPFWTGTFSLLAVFGALVLVTTGRPAGMRPWRDMSLVLSFAGSVLVSVLMSGVGYLHYWLHILPFAAMLTAVALERVLAHPSTRALALGLVVVTVLSCLRHTAPPFVAIFRSPDTLTESWTLQAAAQRIGDVLQPEDKVWAVEGHLILWYLGLPPVSRLAAHPDNIVRPSIVKPLVEAGYVPPDQLAQIYASEPAFVVTRGEGVPLWLQNGPEDFGAWLEVGYTAFFQSEGVMVYRRRDHGMDNG